MDKELRYISRIIQNVLKVIAVIAAVTFSSNALSTKAQTSINIENICLQSPKRCLNVVEDALLVSAEESRRWFDLLQFRFDALFNLKKFIELRKETEPWIHREDVPLPFQVTSLIYFAKSIYLDNEIEKSIHYALLAEEKLTLLQSTFPSPMRLIELANLQMHTNQLEKAYASLLTLAQEYQHSQNAHFMMELHGNLGHLSDKLGDAETSLHYWLTTKEWSFRFGNKQQIAVVTHNLGRIHAQLGNNSLAIANLLIAIEMSHVAGDFAMHAQAKLLLTAVYLSTKDHCLACQKWQSINKQALPDYYLKRYQQVSNEIAAINCQTVIGEDDTLSAIQR